MPPQVAESIFRVQSETDIPPHILARARLSLMKKYGLYPGLAKEPFLKKVDDQITACLYLETFRLKPQDVKKDFRKIDWREIFAIYADPDTPVRLNLHQFVSACRNATISLFLDRESFVGAFPKNTIQSKGARVSDLWRLSRVRTLINEDPDIDFVLPEKRRTFYEQVSLTDTAHDLFDSSEFVLPTTHNPISLSTLLIPDF